MENPNDAHDSAAELLHDSAAELLHNAAHTLINGLVSDFIRDVADGNPKSPVVPIFLSGCLCAVATSFIAAGYEVEMESGMRIVLASNPRNQAKDN